MRLIGVVKGLCIFFSHLNVLKSSCLASLEDQKRQAKVFSSSQLYCPLLSTEMLLDVLLSGWVVAARHFAKPLYTHGLSILSVSTPSLQITHLFWQTVNVPCNDWNVAMRGPHVSPVYLKLPSWSPQFSASLPRTRTAEQSLGFQKQPCHFREFSLLFSCQVVSDSAIPWTPGSMLGFPVLHCLLEFAQIYIHRASDAIQPSHPLSSPSPPAFNLSQHQGLFQ